MAITVPSGFDTAWRLAGSPTSIWPSLVNATYDGKALPPRLVPSALGMIVGLPASTTAAAELLEENRKLWAAFIDIIDAISSKDKWFTSDLLDGINGTLKV